MVALEEEFIIQEPVTSVPSLMAINLVDVEIFLWISTTFDLPVALEESSWYYQSH